MSDTPGLISMSELTRLAYTHLPADEAQGIVGVVAAMGEMFAASREFVAASKLLGITEARAIELRDELLATEHAR